MGPAWLVVPEHLGCRRNLAGHPVGAYLVRSFRACLSWCQPHTCMHPGTRRQGQRACGPPWSTSAARRACSTHTLRRTDCRPHLPTPCPHPAVSHVLACIYPHTYIVSLRHNSLTTWHDNLCCLILDHWRKPVGTEGGRHKHWLHGAASN